MKKIILLIPLLFTHCSQEIVVNTDYDRDIDIHQYQTFNWAPTLGEEFEKNPLYYNDLNDKRIKNTVNEQLKNKGYLLTEQSPQLLLHYHIIVNDKVAVGKDPYGNYGPYWRRARVNFYEYREGTLIIDLVDAKNDDLVWRGWASSILDQSIREVNAREELIRRAVTMILKELPDARIPNENL